MKPQSKPTYLQKRAVVLSAEEKKATALLQQIQSLRKDKIQKRHDKRESKFFPSLCSVSAHGPRLTSTRSCLHSRSG
jgi:hypothetical protein